MTRHSEPDGAAGLVKRIREARDSLQRAHAVYAVAKHAEPEGAIGAVVECAEDDSRDVRVATIAALCWLDARGFEVIQPLRDALSAGRGLPHTAHAMEVVESRKAKT